MHCISRLLLLLVAFESLSAQDSAFDRDPWPAVDKGPIKVFLLAGQSNMQGQASLRTLEYLIYNEETAAAYQHWKDRQGGWNERRDVWVWTSDGERSGNLRPGYGANEWKLGPELGFGWVMGELFDEQVLLIKTCWGGRSVKKDFLPPSESLPDDTVLKQDLERARKRRPETSLESIRNSYGKAYRDMIHLTKGILGNPSKHLPHFKGNRSFELAGFVWFQGWNDMVDGSQRAEDYAGYTRRLRALIRDLRRDLKAPELPVVIGELGATDQAAFHQAQEEVLATEEFAGTGVFVPTRLFWEPEVAQLVNDGVWKGKDWVRFYNVGSDRAYHYLGSGQMMMKIGEAFGRAMESLVLAE